MVRQTLINIDSPDLTAINDIRPTKKIEVTLFFNSFKCYEIYGELIKSVEDRFSENIETGYVNIGECRFCDKNLALISWI